VVGWTMTWAEDRATLGSDPSADPGARPKGGRPSREFAARLSSALRDGIKAVNPSRRSREQAERANDSMPGDGLPDVRNSEWGTIQFRLNQDRPVSDNLAVELIAQDWQLRDRAPSYLLGMHPRRICPIPSKKCSTWNTSFRTPSSEFCIRLFHVERFLSLQVRYFAI